jgi:hypothetical protein
VPGHPGVHPAPGYHYYNGHGGYHGYYGHGYYYGYPYCYAPYWGLGFYYGYGGYPYYDYGYGGDYNGDGYPDYYYGGGYYGHGHGHYVGVATIKLEIEPDDAKVYVDGKYAGDADDFEGVFHHFDVRAGEHDLMLKADGYKTHHVKIIVSPDHSLTLKYDMVKGDGEDQPQNLGSAEEERYDAYADNDRDDDDQPQPPPPRYAHPSDRDRDRNLDDDLDGGSPRTRAGVVRFSVQPLDASIYVDGEFRGTARHIHELRMAPGRHKVEIVRPGFRTLEREVEVHGDKPVDLEAELERN